MDWTQAVDGYCERLDPVYWAEPVNALTNLAFVAVAVWLWPRVSGAARVLCAILAMIGLGSWLFHTHAVIWAGLADVVPIAGFILFYLWLVHRDILGLSAFLSGCAVVMFFPFAAMVTLALGQVPFFEISNFYWTVPILLVTYATFLPGRLPLGFVIGAAILVTSIVFRSLDLMVCDSFPLGTHFMWHVLNAIMLGWMIVVYHRHMLASGGPRR